MMDVDQEKERAMYEELVREWPTMSAENVRKELLEADIDVSFHGTVMAAIEDASFGEAVTVAGIMPIEYAKFAPTFALGGPGEALKAAANDGKPRLIVGKMLVGDGGGDQLAVHMIIAADVREE